MIDLSGWNCWTQSQTAKRKHGAGYCVPRSATGPRACSAMDRLQLQGECKSTAQIGTKREYTFTAREKVHGPERFATSHWSDIYNHTATSNNRP